MNKYSQNGEDGIIEEVLNKIGLSTGIAVEFGGADGLWCSNTAYLREKGWMVYMYDRVKTKYVEARLITPDNVNDLPKCDVLSIDIDGNDYNVWKAYKGKPALVIIEINSSYKPDLDFPVSSEAEGTSYKPMVELGLSKGYFLLCHTGNLIFIDNKYKKLFGDLKDPIKEPYAYFKTDWL